MTDLATIRAAIVAVLRGVPGIGAVHDRRRRITSEQAIADLARAPDGKIHLWMVYRTATAETSPDIGTSIVDHTWEIRGFRQFDEAAGGELALDALVEAIRAAFRASEDLGIAGLATVTETVAGVQVLDTQPVQLGNIICVHARLQLVTRHQE
ncbi:hypothetical protein [Azospirillum sp. A39]|uniref:hypothetical protein n=1 Tax=Azospirillum sp. A39 TaxID=3462279 RepID=UPI004045A64C